MKPHAASTLVTLVLMFMTLGCAEEYGPDDEWEPEPATPGTESTGTDGPSESVAPAGGDDFDLGFASGSNRLPSDIDTWVEGYMAVDVSAGHLAGEFGPVGGVDARVTMTSVFDDETWTDIELHSSTDLGAVMLMVAFEGGINHELFVPGSSHTFALDQIGLGTSGAPFFVTALACSGPQAYAWDWDHLATSVTVDVAPTAVDVDVREITITAEVPQSELDIWEGHTETVVGTFTVSK